MTIPILLPDNAQILVTAGQTVSFDTPFLSALGTETVKLPLAQALGFPPDKIFTFLRKFVGDSIKKDDLIAEKKTMMSSKQYLSEFDGTILEVDHHDGSIILGIQSSSITEKMCWFSGTIDSIEGNILALKVKKSSHYSLQEQCPNMGGRVLFYTPEVAPNLTQDEIDDAVVFAEKIPGFDHSKLEALGANGFVVNITTDDPSEVPVAILKDPKDLVEIKALGYSSCIIGADHTTIYLYD
jgi:hypothetical protein